MPPGQRPGMGLKPLASALLAFVVLVIPWAIGAWTLVSWTIAGATR